MTINDLLENVTLQGFIKIQNFEGDEPTIYYEGDAKDIKRNMEDYMDRKITYIFPYNTGYFGAICVEIEEG